MYTSSSRSGGTSTWSTQEAIFNLQQEYVLKPRGRHQHLVNMRHILQLMKQQQEHVLIPKGAAQAPGQQETIFSSSRPG